MYLFHVHQINILYSEGSIMFYFFNSASASTLTCVKLQLGFLSEVAVSEGVTISGCSPLQHSGPVDGSKNRHQHPHQGACKETEPGMLISFRTTEE